MKRVTCSLLASVLTFASAEAQPSASCSPEVAVAVAATQALEPTTTVLRETPEGRLLKHGLGESTVPSDPQRVVVLEPSLGDVAVALGVTPVGAVTETAARFHEHLQPYFDGVQPIGFEWEPNLEAIVALEPDLILTWDYYRDRYDQLSQIAPTVALPYTAYEAEVGLARSNTGWLTWFVRDMGVVLNREDRVEAVLADYEAAVQKARGAMTEAVGDAPVAVMDVRADRILLGGLLYDGVMMTLYGDLCLTPEPSAPQDEGWVDISLETLPEISAEHIFLFVSDDEAEERYAELSSRALWQGIPAVQEENVYLIPPGLYYRGDDGPLGAAQMLDDMALQVSSRNSQENQGD